MNQKLIRYLQNNHHKLKLPDIKPKVEERKEDIPIIIQELKTNEGTQRTSTMQQPDIMKSSKLNSINFGSGLDYSLGTSKKGRRKNTSNNNGTFNF